MFDSNAQKIIIFIICCSLFVLILIGFIVLLVYRHKQRQQFFFKSIKSLETQHENEILLSHIEIQEQTFQNISREIHDNIGQKLSLVKLHLNTYYKETKKPDSNQVLDSINIITQTINDLSDLSKSFSSEQILKNGIIPALEYEVLQLRRSGVFDIELNTAGTVLHIEQSKELVLFRIVQEALNNIVKHAAASKVELNFFYRDDHILLVIKDDGNGFSQNLIRQPGMGLLNMKKRASAIKAELDISSVSGSGTKLSIKIPSL
jgi:two-component system NarL family sensor kinase